MQLKKVYELTIETQETILCANFSSPSELVLLMSDGNVVRFNTTNSTYQNLFSVKSFVQYADGGFDLNESATIYTLDSIVVLANDRKRHVFVHYPEKYYALRLMRGEYHADVSYYPIALFKNEMDIPHLIYGEDWNHVQILNIDTRQVLTAAKSLIEEGAEENHVEFYKKHTEHNKLVWPRPLDYFFGELEISPDKKHFLSKGWAWGSCDCYHVFNIEHFIQNNRISYINIDTWEHSERAACWIDEKTIAVAYHPFSEGDDHATRDMPLEIHFYEINANSSQLVRKIALSGFNKLSSTFHFSKALNAIVAFHKDNGAIVFALDGTVLCQESNFKPMAYYDDARLFIEAEDKTISIYEICS